MKRKALLLLAVAVGLALVGSAAARPPANDAFSAAVPIAGEAGSVAGSTVDATRERGEPEDGSDEDEGGSVWYRWTAPSSGPYVFRTCRANFDSLLVVYTGPAVDSLTRIARNDDSCDTGSEVAVPAVAGTVYSIAVATFEGEPGSFVLEWEKGQPPSNDPFAAPIELSGRSGAATATMRFATRETGEPSHGSGAGSVWFTWTPTESGVVRFAASRELRVAVYLGDSLRALRLVGLADTATHALGFEALAGNVYRIAVAGPVPVRGGEFKVDWAHVAEPVNDAFERPYVLNDDAGESAASLLASTFETGEPSHGGARASGSVWYVWRAERGGRVAFTVCSGGPIVSASIYVGDSLTALERVGSTTGVCRTAGRIAFDARAGTQYRLALAGPRTALGVVSVTWDAPPANDDFLDAIPIAGDSAAIDATTVGATRESGESEHRAGGIASVWYAWTAPASGPFVIDTCKRGEANVVVYTGTTFSSMAPVAQDDAPTCDEGSAVRFHAAAGTTYRIAVVSTEDSIGAFTLRLRSSPIPANDALARALRLRGISGAAAATTIGATRDSRDPRPQRSAGASVWFRWTAPRDAWVAFDTCSGTEGDTILAVYRRDARARLRVLASGDDECYPGDRVILHARAGVEYAIAVMAVGTQTGDLTLRWARIAPPDCRVPDVVGEKLSAALRQIASAYCRAEVRRVESKLVKPGRVIAQSPRDGQRRPHGAIVRLEIASR